MQAKTFGILLGTLFGLSLGSVREAGAIEHYLTTTPATQFIPETGANTIPDCFYADYAGGVFMNSGSLCSPANGTVKTANFGLPWAENPGSTVTVFWYAFQPASSTIRARVRARNVDGSIYSSSGWVSGGGSKTAWTDTTGGPLILQVETTATSTAADPGVTWFASQVYSN